MLRRGKGEALFLFGRFRKYAVEARELHRRMASGERFTVIDVRREDEFRGEEGRIPGARLVPLSRIRAEGSAALADVGDGPLLLVCSRGLRSALALALLRKSGRELISLKGGMKAWSRSGFEVIRDPAPGHPLMPARKEC
jgi:rhodanese-related sulfurtransferase